MASEAALIRTDSNDVSHIEFPDSEVLKWAYRHTDSDLVEFVPLTPYLHAFVDEEGLRRKPFNRQFTSIAVALAMQPTQVNGHAVIMGSTAPGGAGENRALTENEMALIEAAAERPVAVGALVLDTSLLAVAEADWKTVISKGPLPRILPCKPDEVRRAGAEIQRLRAAVGDSATVSRNTFAGVADGVRLSVRLRPLPELDREMLEGWAWSHYEGDLSSEDEQTLYESAVAFFEGTRDDLSAWFALSRLIDVDDIPMVAAMALAAGGLDIGDIPRFARLGIRDADIARKALADDIPDEFLAALSD